MALILDIAAVVLAALAALLLGFVDAVAVRDCLALLALALACHFAAVLAGATWPVRRT